jgi:hypothetical protein
MGAGATHENAGTDLESIDSGGVEKATQRTKAVRWVVGLSLSVVMASPTAASPASAAVTAPTQVQSAVKQLAAAGAGGDPVRRHGRARARRPRQMASSARPHAEVFVDEHGGHLSTPEQRLEMLRTLAVG